MKSKMSAADPKLVYIGGLALLALGVYLFFTLEQTPLVRLIVVMLCVASAWSIRYAVQINRRLK
jgi:steroid 5-alpha reductase family enzyme